MIVSTPQKMGIAVISNVIFDPFFVPSIKKQFESSLSDIEVYPIPYEERFEFEQKERINASSQIIVWLNIESLPLDEYESTGEVVDICKLLYSELSVISNAKIFWFI